MIWSANHGIFSWLGIFKLNVRVWAKRVSLSRRKLISTTQIFRPMPALDIVVGVFAKTDFWWKLWLEALVEIVIGSKICELSIWSLFLCTLWMYAFLEMLLSKLWIWCNLWFNSLRCERIELKTSPIAEQHTQNVKFRMLRMKCTIWSRSINFINRAEGVQHSKIWISKPLAIQFLVKMLTLAAHFETSAWWN